MRRATDETHHAGFDVGQEQVLLRLIETMDLVDHEDGLTRGRAPGLGEDLAKFGRARKNRVDAHDRGLRFGGNHFG